MHAPIVETQPVTAANGDVTILPQRVTGSQYAQPPKRSLLRNWPLLVIILACIAIIVAVVIMVMPAGSGRHGGKRELMPAPAPDRMETNPGHDPWGGAQPPGPQAPNTAPPVTPAPPPDDDSQAHAQPQPQPRVTPDPPKAPDPRDPDDLFGQLGQNANMTMIFTFADKLCKKMASCPGADQSTLQLACGTIARMPMPPIPSTCAAAQRCTEAIEQLPCDDTTANDPTSGVMMMQDCMRAMTDC